MIGTGPPWRREVRAELRLDRRHVQRKERAKHRGGRSADGCGDGWMSRFDLPIFGSENSAILRERQIGEDAANRGLGVGGWPQASERYRALVPRRGGCDVPK